MKSQGKRKTASAGKGLKSPGGTDADIRYKALFDQSPYGVLVIDKDGRLLDFNEAAHERLGYSREEFAGLRTADLYAVRSADEIKRDLQSVLKQGTAEFNVEYRAKNGDIRDVHIVARAIDLSGIPVFHVFWRDITDRRRAEDEKRPGEREEARMDRDKRYLALFDNTQLGIVMIDAEGRIADCNRAFQEMLGYGAAELRTMTISDINPPGDDRATREHYRAMVDGRIDSFTAEKRHVRKDGTIIWTNLTGTLIRDGSRPSKLLFGIVEDITERKKAENSLRISEARLNEAQQIAHVGNWDWDIGTNRVFWSDELYCIYGYAPGEVAPDYGLVVEAMRPDSRKAFLDAIDAALNGRRPFEMDYSFYRKDGTVAILHTIGKVKYDAEGRPAWMSGIVQDITERKRSEESLLLFTNLLNQSKDAIFVNDPATGRFLIVNDKACSNLGYGREELLTKRTLDIETSFSDQAAWDAHVGEVRDKGYLILEGENRRSDGTLFPVEVNVTYMTLGGRDYMVAVVRDIMERKLAEQALRISEERLSKAQKMAHVGNWEWDMVADRLYWSDEVYRIYGVDPARFVPTFKSVETAMHPDDLEPFLKAVNAAIYDHQLFEMDYRLIRPDGTVRTVHTIGEVLYDDAGKPLVKSGTVQDVTEIKKTEEALRSSRDFIEKILNTVDEAFIVIDRDFRIVRANNAYSMQVDRPVEEIVGKHCFEVSHQRTGPCDEADDGPPEECAVRQCFVSGQPRTCVHKHIGRQGSVIYAETKAFPLKNAAGEVTSAIEVINNITDKHLLEEQMLRAQKLEAVGLLAGGIAHDFNNLLQGVFGSISMAKMFSGGGKAHAMLEGAESALYQATNLTKQLLTFSKGGEPIKKTIALSSVVDNAARFSLSGSNIDYRSSCDERLWPVEADEGQLTQVIHNIVLNGCEAMPEGGTIWIDLGNVVIDEASSLPLKPGKYVLLEIRDTGAGIPERHLAKIFDPYFTTKKKGSGLGLATSYSIVKRHGGVIMVRSQPDGGSTFSLYLPASEAGVPASAPSPAALVTGRGRVLIMDDEEIVRAVAGHMVQGLGYDFDAVENGEQALEKYAEAMNRDRPYAAVILDLTVRGGMGGKEAIRKLTAMHPSVRAVVSSGYSADDLLSRYQEYGFRAVLTKPYQIEDLSRVLHSMLGGDEKPC